ncbi:flagellar hook-associated protein FlgK [Cohnella fermenti]|uniref:Flagellar hook-associated protein 1 n=1 Tax=Cohnella fermenti TaxID=2565925 RepID=A0A4S4C164_9BACL|nr:flagellar hook-associated protein FlgK [Cohnella fermenti]THF80809.1 flagellar hook-associated protein FlgK [Cohnella fermenti]
MTSSFLGIETSKRALLTTSLALQTVGQNVANASTEGYTRQKVNVSASRPQEAVGLYTSTTASQIGTGVQADSITRIRESYLDTQYRRENQNLGYWSVRNSNLESIQSIMNEPTENGIRGVMDEFWDSLEVLNSDPTLLSARVNVISTATNMVDTFNQADASLTKLSSDLDGNITSKVSEANTLITSIAQLNDYIRKAEGLGGNANDYRDQRDLALDKLSQIANIEYAETPEGDFTLSVAGVEVVNNRDATLLTEDAANTATAGELAGYVQAKADIEHIRTQLNALVTSFVSGDVDVTLENGYVAAQDMVAKNDVTLANGSTITAGTTIPAGSEITSSVTFTVQGFNGLHSLGYGTGTPATAGVPFFTSTDGGAITMANIQVNPTVASDTSKVAASAKYENVSGTNTTIKGNSDIAFALSSLRDKTFSYSESATNLTSGTIDDYFRAVTSELGITASEATRNMDNQQNLVDAADSRRQEVSGVSLDEEMTDIIKFQHTYNAAARMMTTVDEMLDRVINSMGRVGL